MKELLRTIADDTLKKDVEGVRRFCRMKLTMFTAWIFCLGSAGIDFLCNGLRFEVWLTMVGIASGTKLIEAGAKRIQK